MHGEQARPLPGGERREAAPRARDGPRGGDAAVAVRARIEDGEKARGRGPRDRGDSGGFCAMAAGYTRTHKRSDTDLTSLGEAEGECECEPLMRLPDGQREPRHSLSGVLGGGS